MDIRIELELAALRLIVSNVIGRLAEREADGGRAMLREMADQCKLAAEHMSVGPDRCTLVLDTQICLDEFFKGITIT
jgi:hypothetical protein